VLGVSLLPLAYEQRLSTLLAHGVGLWDVIAEAERTGSLDAAIALCADAPEAWVIGGGEVYAQALPLAQRVVVTEIDADVEGDTFAPVLDAAEWREVARTGHRAARDGLPFAFVTFDRG